MHASLKKLPPSPSILLLLLQILLHLRTERLPKERTERKFLLGDSAYFYTVVANFVISYYTDGKKRIAIRIN